MLRSAKVGIGTVKGTVEVCVRGPLKGLNNRFPDCNAKNASPKKIVELIRMNSYLHCKAAVSFSTSCSSDDGEERNPQDLFVQIWNYLVRLGLKDYKFHNTVASPEELPKADVLIRYRDYPEMWPRGSVFRKETMRPPLQCPIAGSGVSKSRPKYTLGSGLNNFRKVFEYNPSENCMVESPTLLRSLHALLVEEIDGKIYIARAHTLYESTIRMEVFDPWSANPSWEELPYLLEPILYGCHFVVGHKLYIESRCNKMYCYDTVGRVWATVDVGSMFKNRFSFGGCSPYVDYFNGQPIPVVGKMVCEYIVIALQVCSNVDKKPRLLGYLYSKDGCLLAMQDLGAFHEDFIAITYHLEALEDGKFCALAVGSNSKNKSKRLMAVSIFSATELPMAAQLRDKDPLVDASSFELEENKFLSVSVQNQYYFDFERKNQPPDDDYIVGVFSLP